MSVNSGLKATKIIDQRKAFYRQRIPESSCARKETVDIDIFVKSRNADRKIMQSIRITSRPPLRESKWNQLRQFRWTSSKGIPIEKTKAGYILTMCQLLNRIFNNCTQLSIHSYHPDKGNKLNVNKTESSVFAAVNREWEGGSRFT